MTKMKILNKIDAYQFAIRTNNQEWINSILSFLESENCHTIVRHLQNNQFDEAKQEALAMFK